MKNILLFMSLLFLAFSAHAAVYKHVDEHGNLIKYSDQPQKAGDKPLDLPEPSSPTSSSGSDAPPPPRFTPAKPEKESEPEIPVTAYAAVTIVKPDNEESIRANGGIFPIEVASQPPLNAAADHRYVIIVDGKKHQDSDKAQFELRNMDRGEHSISVQIQDKKGKVLTSSSSITVYVMRASAPRPTPYRAR